MVRRPQPSKAAFPGRGSGEGRTVRAEPRSSRSGIPLPVFHFD